MKQPISILPAIALRGTTILPDMIVHFDVSRERSIKAIEAAMLHDQKIFLVTQKDPESEKVRGLELSIEEIRQAKDELIRMSNDSTQRELYDMRAKFFKGIKMK